MRKALLVILFFCICIAARAQKQIDFTPAKLTNESDIRSKFRHYRALKIDLNRLFSDLGSSHGGYVKINLDGLPDIQADLTETTLLAPDYFETIASRNGFRRKTGSTIRTFQGILRNNGGKMSLTIDHDFFSAVISGPGRTLYIEQARSIDRAQDRETVILYDARDVVSDNQEVQCGVEATEMRAAELRRSKSAERAMAGSCKVAELAIAADSSMFTKFGDAASVSAHIVAVMNNVAVLYRHEFDDNLEFRIVTIYQSQTYNNDPLSPATASTTAGVLLGAFKTWGQAGNFNAGFDLAQFWTNRDFDGSTVGLAYVDAMCGGSRYHVLQDYSSSMSNLSVLAAHEMGHNFGASHDPAGSPFIMAPSVNATSEWSSVSRAAVSTGITTAVCLAGCTDPVVPAFILSPAAVCVGDSIHFKDKTINGTTRNWTFPSGVLPNSAEARPVIKYPTAGVYDITLASAGAPALVARNAVVVGNPDLNTAACAVPSGVPGNGGIRYFALNTISSSSGNAATDAAKYVDRSCKYVTALSLNTAYNVTIQVGSSGEETPKIYETLKIYIDYNGDGVFDEANEKVSDAGDAYWRGTLGYDPSSRPWLRFTTPNTARRNKLLRMRVVTDSHTIANACYNPVEGQVEEFGVIFPDNSGALPVDLISFSGKNMGKYTLLEWKVVNESLMTGYTVQRSEDAVSFSDIGEVMPENGGARRLEYQLEDDHIGDALGYYYRLRMDDSDGSSKLSKIIYVGEFGSNAGLSLRKCQTIVASSTITYELVSEISRKVDFEILDLKGNRVKSWNRELAKGNNAMSDDVSGIDPGFYLLAIRAEGTQPIVRKIVRSR